MTFIRSKNMEVCGRGVCGERGRDTHDSRTVGPAAVGLVGLIMTTLKINLTALSTDVSLRSQVQTCDVVGLSSQANRLTKLTKLN